MLAAIIAQGFSQEASAGNRNLNNQADSSLNTTLEIGNDLLVVNNDKESLDIRVGNRGLSILESMEGKGPKIEFRKFERDETDEFITQSDDDEEKARRRSRFKGHWAGVEFGFNNYVTSDRSLSLPPEIEYMNLHSGKSSAFNLNFSQKSLGLTRRIGLVTGMGLNWNNYRFDGNNNIVKGTNGIIENLDPGANLEKSKLTTLYLTVPLLLEIQIPADHNHINLAAGVIGGIKVGSHSKMVFENGDRVKSKDDFSLNMLRYGVTARAGYENFQFYGNYYPTALFKSGKSPEGIALYPFEIGVAFTFND